MSDLVGKRVLITGASRGLGKRLALDFGREGARVVVNYATSMDLAEGVVREIAGAGGDAMAAKADIVDREQVSSLFEQIDQWCGGLDVLINNAGLNRDAPLLDMTEDDWDAVVATNMKGPFLCSQAAGRMMTTEHATDGRIINMSATTATTGRIGAANYACAKAGLNMLTKCLALELAPKVSVNSIALGFLDSPLVREVFSPEQIAAAVGATPAGRMGTFDEASRLARYLASDAAGFVTGQTIHLDGGRVMQ